MWLVYTIRHRTTGRIIYVGMTQDKARRLRDHNYAAKAATPPTLVSKYIAEMSAKGHRFRMFAEAEFESKKDASKHERELIRKHQGKHLLNVSGNRIGNTHRAWKKYMQRKKAMNEVLNG